MSHYHFRLHARRWAAARRGVFERDGYRCRECGQAGRLECDHIRPLHRGGDPWVVENLQTLCRECHIHKTRSENARPRTPVELSWAALVEDMRTV